MSRAFVKESDGDEAEGLLPDRPISSHPNYVTPGGLRQLHRSLEALERERQALRERPDDVAARARLPKVEQDLRYFRQRLQTAIEVQPPPNTDTVRFGCVVEIENEGGQRHSYRIVGEDEADASQGRISWISPLARALRDHRVDDEVEWPRPDGAVQVTIVGIRTA